MKAEELLEHVKKLDELIDGKLVERAQIMDLATRMGAEMDGMPHAKGNVSDPVGNGAVKLALLAKEIDRLVDHYVDYKNWVISLLEKLPEPQHGVLHRYYIRYMTNAKIAEEMGYCEKQVSRIKKKGLKNLEDVLECPHIRWYNGIVK